MKKGIISKVYPGNTHFTETLVRVLFQMRKDERKNPNLQSVVHTIYSDSGQQKLRDLPALKNDVVDQRFLIGINGRETNA